MNRKANETNENETQDQANNKEINDNELSNNKNISGAGEKKNSKADVYIFQHNH